MGPMLVRQEQADARSVVDGRLEFLEKELCVAGAAAWRRSARFVARGIRPRAAARPPAPPLAGSAWKTI